MDTLFLVEADPTTISENGSLKDPQLRVCKIGKPVLRPENVHSRIQKRCYKKWPYCRPETGDFSGFISDIVFGSASTRQKRAHFRMRPSISYNGVSESENEIDFRVAKSDGQYRIDDPHSETRTCSLFSEQSSREK